VATPGLGCAVLEDAANRGVDVALVLAQRTPDAADVLDVARRRHPHARRGFLLKWYQIRSEREDIAAAFVRRQVECFVTKPAGDPDERFHRSITESFYVLSGTIRLHDGNGWTEGRPGDFLYVPQGGVHGFRNESGEPASMLILFTPGAPREDYFERVRTTSAMTEEERAEFFLRHDTFWV